MRTSLVLIVGIVIGAAIAPGSAQDQKLPGDNYVNHVGFAVDNFDEAFNFYTQKMGFREAFTVTRSWKSSRPMPTAKQG